MTTNNNDEKPHRSASSRSDVSLPTPTHLHLPIQAPTSSPSANSSQYHLPRLNTSELFLPSYPTDADIHARERERDHPLRSHPSHPSLPDYEHHHDHHHNDPTTANDEDYDLPPTPTSSLLPPPLHVPRHTPTFLPPSRVASSIYSTSAEFSTPPGSLHKQTPHPHLPPPHHQRQRRRGWFRTTLSLLPPLLLLPLLLLILALNLTSHTPGATLTPGAHAPNPLSRTYATELASLARSDHDVRSLLQAAAKALEILFVAGVVGGLVACLLLGGGQGGATPVGWLAAPLEVRGGLGFLASRRLWGGVKGPGPGPGPGRGGGRGRVGGYARVVGVVVLGLEAAVLGPALAVLLLPTLQFRRVRFEAGAGAVVTTTGPRSATAALAAAPRNPALDRTGTCTAALLAAGDYSCLGATYGLSLDAMLTAAAASALAQQPGAPGLAPAVAQEGSVFFQVNDTWAPNRWVLREVSSLLRAQVRGWAGDAGDAGDVDDALEVVYHRTGPVVGVPVGCARVNVTVIPAGEGREVRCYGVDVFAGQEVRNNSCVASGPGWGSGSATTAVRGFGVDWQAKWGGTWVAAVNVSVFGSDKRVDLPWGGGDGRCALAMGYDGTYQPLNNRTCDWDALFRANPPAPAQYVEYRVPGLTFPNQTVVCQSTARLGFADYTSSSLALQPDRFALVTLADLPAPAASHPQAPMHPDYLLAAWSTAHNATVPANRASAQLVVGALKRLLDAPAPTAADAATAEAQKAETYFTLLQQLILAHAGSLVDFPAPDNATTTGADGDADAVYLSSYREVKVYAYGFTAPATVLAGAVVGVAALCCLLRILTILVPYFGGQERSVLELLGMAVRCRDEAGAFEAGGWERVGVRVLRRGDGRGEEMVVVGEGGHRDVEERDRERAEDAQAERERKAVQWTAIPIPAPVTPPAPPLRRVVDGGMIEPEGWR